MTDEFGADLVAILDVAQNKLPRLIDAVGGATGEVAGTSGNDSKVFASESKSPVDGGGPGMSIVGEAWTSLRDTYQMILARTQDNLGDTAVALIDVVNHYAETDGYSAEQLGAAVADYNANAAADEALEEVEPPAAGGDKPYQPPTYDEPDYPDDGPVYPDK